MASDRIAFVEELREKFEDSGVPWPFGDGPFESVWKGKTRLYDTESYDSEWGRNVVSGTGESKVHELAVRYRGQELLLTTVADELKELYKPDEIKAYLLEIVETGKTRKQRSREESEVRDRRWREFAQRKFRSLLHLSPAQNLLAELSVDYPRVAEVIEAEKLGQWMDDWYPYTPQVKDIIQRLAEFGLPAELALPEPPAPKVETPEEARERVSQQKFGRSYVSLVRGEQLWVLLAIVNPKMAASYSARSIGNWANGKTQRFTGEDIEKAIREGRIRR